MPNATFPHLPYLVMIDGEFLNGTVDYKKNLEINPIGREENFGSESSKMSEEKMVLKSTLVSEPKNWIIPSVLPQSCVFLVKPISTNEALEQEIINRFRKIDKVLKIFIANTANLTLVKVMLNTETYDYDLMDIILNNAEFPIKDSFRSKLIDFEYLPFSREDEDRLISQYKLIYNTVLNEQIETYAVFSESIPTLTWQM